MSENTENFEQLRRLMALKRHEQPHPRYFNDFSSQVIARIKLGETGDDAPALKGMFWEAPWLQRLWAALETKPILAGAVGVAACALLVSGVVYSDRIDSLPVNLVPVAEADSAPVALANVSAANHPLLARPVTLEPSSTSPIDGSQIANSRSAASLLDDFSRLQGQAERTAWTMPAGN